MSPPLVYTEAGEHAGHGTFLTSSCVTFQWKLHSHCSLGPCPVSCLSRAEATLASDFSSSAPLRTFSSTNRLRPLNFSSMSSDSSFCSCSYHSPLQGPCHSTGSQSTGSRRHPGLFIPHSYALHRAAHAFSLEVTNCGLGMHPIKRRVRYMGFLIFPLLHMRIQKGRHCSWVNISQRPCVEAWWPAWATNWEVARATGWKLGF